jgi:hypothetical protein
MASFSFACASSLYAAYKTGSTTDMRAATLLRTIVGTTLALLIAGCAHRDKTAPAPVEPSAPVAAPTPSPTPTINSDLGPEEAVWHLRAALNVAALSCGQGPAGVTIVTRYNAFLTERKGVLAAAYAAERARHASAAMLDRHMTQLYNFFADPASQRGFCAVARTVADRASTTPADSLANLASTALVELERADSVSQPNPATRIATLAPAAPSAAPWRIQIGAFTGRPAAEAAWQKALARVPSLAAYQPAYEQVPGKPLVRVQVGVASDRAGAIRLCAAAAAGGFDCMPIGS